MKQYTTPTIIIRLPESEQLLETARRVIVTAKGNRKLSNDYDATVDGDRVIVKLSQEDTGAIGGSNVDFEVTVIAEDGSVMKSDTVSANINTAVRNKVLDNG